MHVCTYTHTRPKVLLHHNNKGPAFAEPTLASAQAPTVDGVSPACPYFGVSKKSGSLLGGSYTKHWMAFARVDISRLPFLETTKYVQYYHNSQGIINSMFATSMVRGLGRVEYGSQEEYA